MRQGWRGFVRLFVAAALAAPALAAGPEGRPGVVRSEFVYETAPFPSCHASTIVEVPGGLVAAWFGGTAEGNPDVGIWLSRHDGTAWSKPVEVARGDQRDGPRLPCWNPVLFQLKEGPLLLFSKVGPNPREWWGEERKSTDEGRTWGPPARLGVLLGPIKNKPIERADGTILCPSSTEDEGWRVHFESTDRFTIDWTRSDPVQGEGIEAIQPCLLTLADGRIRALCRSQKTGIVATDSRDGGRTWTPLAATGMPNPNSGIDAQTLADGRHLLVHNPVAKGRTPLVVSVSADGSGWKQAAVLEDEPGEYSYPAIIQARDGRVHVTYTWNRKKIRHVVLDPAALRGGDAGPSR